MILKIIGKNRNGYVDFEQTSELSTELLYEIKLGNRTVFTQLKMSNKEILTALIEEMKEWNITCEQKGGYMIFKKDNKEYRLLDITNSNEQPYLDPIFYKKLLSDSILKTLL